MPYKTFRRHVTKRTSSTSAPWDRLVWDGVGKPKRTWGLFVDDGFKGWHYLHVPCRPHPDDPQDAADLWTNWRVFPRWQCGQAYNARWTVLTVGVEKDAESSTGWTWVIGCMERLKGDEDADER